MKPFAGIGAMSKDESLNRAAAIHIRLGNLQRYCELMVELGKVSIFISHWCYYDSKRGNSWVRHT
jgi:hypothetical protein